MSQIELRNLLNQVIKGVGIKGKVISAKTGITQAELSRFKNGQISLCLMDSQRLESYLDTFKSMI